MAQAGPGKVPYFDDFAGGIEQPVGNSTAPPLDIGNSTFELVGQGIQDTDSGAVLQGAPMSSILITATNEPEHAAGLNSRTSCFDVGLQGTIVMEARVQQAALTSRQVFVGFSDVKTDLAILEGAILKGDTVTITLTASDICGFLMASELSDSADWHGVYKGGTAAGETVSTSVDLDADAAAATWQILRLEMDLNGNARWFVDGELKQSVAGAVSTTTDLCFNLIVEEKGSSLNANIEVDYVRILCNRDWTV
jgi:hypothetical protein